MGAGLSTRKTNSASFHGHRGMRNVEAKSASGSRSLLKDIHPDVVATDSLENCEFTWTQLPHYLQQFILHAHMRNASDSDTSLDSDELNKLKELVQQELVPSESCYICSVYSPQETQQCNMCQQSFHESCLVVMGQLNNEDEIRRFKRSDDDVTDEDDGWFCGQCEKMAKILKQYGAGEVLDFLENIRLDDETLKSMRNTIKSNHSACAFDKRRMTLSNRSSDAGVNYHWWEFLHFETVKRLSLSSIKLLTPSRRKKITNAPSDINLNNSRSPSFDFPLNGNDEKSGEISPASANITFSPVTRISHDRFKNWDELEQETNRRPNSSICFSGREHNNADTWNVPGTASNSPIYCRKISSR